MTRPRKKRIDIISAIVLIALLTLDIMLWKEIIHIPLVSAKANVPVARIYSFPMKQGTSTLCIFANGITVLTDAGSDASIVDALQKALPSGAPSYIDLAIISAPEFQDYAGYLFLLQHYRVGAFLYNGRSDDDHVAEWSQFIAQITAKHIPIVTIGAGDRIRLGTPDEIEIVAPDVAFAHSPSVSDTAIIQHIVTSGE
jgi:hypothetical protein